MTFNEKEYIQDFINKYSLKCEEIAESELAEIILQMIKSGDILRLVTPVDFKTNENDYKVTASAATKLVYRPYLKVERIKQDLQKALEEIERLCTSEVKRCSSEYLESGSNDSLEYINGKINGLDAAIAIVEGVLEKHEN